MNIDELRFKNLVDDLKDVDVDKLSSEELKSLMSSVDELNIKMYKREKVMGMFGFRNLLYYISQKHSFRKGGKRIKYVEPVIDMRTGEIFCIKFRGFNDKTFSVTNENAGRNLEKWIYDWLDDK